MNDLIKQLGRDGSYVEMDVSKMDAMIDALRNGTEFRPKMICLKQGRLDLSEPDQVQGFLSACSSLVDSPETEGMDNAQMGLWMFRKIFEAGIKAVRDRSKGEKA